MSLRILAVVCVAAADTVVLPIDTPTSAVNLVAASETGAPRYTFQVVSGRIWARHVDSDAEWSLFSGTGLPPGVTEVTEISADGRNLIALDPDRAVHYTKLDSIRWTSTWLSLPVFGAIKNLLSGAELRMPPSRGWSVSHRGPENEYYEDILGKRHPVGTGVTTLYALSNDGRTIRYADPWLPNRFDNTVPMPEHGTFVAEAMSASASTLFVIARTVAEPGGAEAHAMYTRLYDFDTSGNNPFLSYTYERTDDPDLRTLPAEPWRRQPDIPLAGQARLTARIAIYQLGKGNAARELRVEGTGVLGDSGYYRKRIDAATWEFVQTGHPIDPALFLARPESSAPQPAVIDCPTGILEHEAAVPWAADLAYPAALSRFSPQLDDVRIRVAVGSEILVLHLHSRRGLLNLLGSQAPKRELVVPEGTFRRHGDNDAIATLLAAAFDNERVTSVSVDRDGHAVRIEPVFLSDGDFELRFTGCHAAP